MEHIREVDEEESTVIVMQVENEIGLLNTARDYSALANGKICGGCAGRNCKIVQRERRLEICICRKCGRVFYGILFRKGGRKDYKCRTREISIAMLCKCVAAAVSVQWQDLIRQADRCVKYRHGDALSHFTLAPDIYVPYVANVLDEYGYEGIRCSYRKYQKMQ